MKPIPFAINGLGRIGRALLRIAAKQPDLELVAVNDLAPAATLARLVARDSVHGRYEGEVAVDGSHLLLDGRQVAVFQQADVAVIPWQQTAAAVVVDATGRATAHAVASRHLHGPVRKVLISALCEDADVTLCPGLPNEVYLPRQHRVISGASCTTHCLALLLAVLHEGFGVRSALMNEVHSYTSNQALVDAVHADPRRGRAAAANIVPTTTAAPAAIERLLPQLAGRVIGQAVRVPTPNVALLDLVVALSRPATAEALGDAFRQAAAGEMKGLLGVSDEPLVSSDYVGEHHSAVVDLSLLQVAATGLVRVAAWYDNEWGYAHRLADFLRLIGESLREDSREATTTAAGSQEASQDGAEEVVRPRTTTERSDA